MKSTVPNPAPTGGLRSAVRRTGTGAVCTAVAGLLITGVAHADTFVPLPDGREFAPGATVTRTGEHAVVSPSMAANGAGRVVWVSGTVTAEVTDTPTVERPGPYSTPADWPGTNNSSTHAASQVNTGYLVGCQVSIGDRAITAGLAGNLGTNGGGVGGSVGVQLGPGEVEFVQIGFKDILRPGVYHLGYRDFEIEIQGCGGYAQARSYTVVEIIGDHYSKTTLYGAPFSIG